MDIKINCVKGLTFSRKAKEVSLWIAKDKKSKPVIYVGNEKKTIYLKKFLGDWDYNKFLVEAIILRMVADKKSVSKARDIYCTIVDVVNDENKRDFELD